MVLVALLAWAFAPRPMEVEAAEADRGPFETTIDEEGRTRLRDRYTVAAPLGGRLERIALRPGDTVARDAVVAALTATPAPMLDERTRSQLFARVDAARALVQQAGAGVASAQVALAQAEAERRRSEQLAREGFVAGAKQDTDRLAEQAAQRSLEAAVEGRRVATSELAQARAALEASQPGGASGRRFEVRSPVAGRVLRVLQPSETAVAPGTPLLEIGDIGQLEVVAELLTSDALQARPGGAVRIEQWGGPGALSGRVRQVEPAAFTKISALGVEEQRVNVLIDLLPPASPPPEWQALGDGYRVAVRIVTLSVPDALRVPVSAVFPRGAAAGEGGAERGHAVFVIDGGRAREQPVTVGGRNGRHAWVQDGLQPGQRVIVYPPPGVAEGVRVAVRRTD